MWGFLDQGNRTQFSKLQIAFEFPHPPVHGAGNQHSESKRKNKHHLPLFLPSLNSVICVALSTFHPIYLGLGSAVNVKSKQIVTSKEQAVILDCFIYNPFIIFYLFIWDAYTSQSGFFFPFVKRWLSIPSSNCSPLVIYTGLEIITAVLLNCCRMHVHKSLDMSANPCLWTSLEDGC